MSEPDDRADGATGLAPGEARYAVSLDDGEPVSVTARSVREAAVLGAVELGALRSSDPGVPGVLELRVLRLGTLTVREVPRMW